MLKVSYADSVIGFKHLKANQQKPCQDYSAKFETDEYTIITVADGHGGDDYFRSQIGSQKACMVAIRNIKAFLDLLFRTGQHVAFLVDDILADINVDSSIYEKDYQNKIVGYRLLKQLEASIINDWNQEVKRDFTEHPFTEEELTNVSIRAKQKYLQDDGVSQYCHKYSAYGTTLIAVVQTKSFWFGIQIGDGQCAKLDRNGKFSLGIPINDKCFLNSTTSLCDKDAIESFREFYSTDLPIGLFIGTDGVEDCFKVKHTEQLYKFYEIITCSFTKTDCAVASKELSEYLPYLSEKGSGDDISVAFIIDKFATGQLPFVKNYVVPNNIETEQVESSDFSKDSTNFCHEKQMEEHLIVPEWLNFEQNYVIKMEDAFNGNSKAYCPKITQRRGIRGYRGNGNRIVSFVKRFFSF